MIPEAGCVALEAVFQLKPGKQSEIESRIKDLAVRRRQIAALTISRPQA